MHTFAQIVGHKLGAAIVNLTQQQEIVACKLADFLVKLQCTEAMNLDGGGSAEVWMEGKILNSPCYGHERSTANALVLVEKETE